MAHPQIQLSDLFGVSSTKHSIDKRLINDFLQDAVNEEKINMANINNNNNKTHIIEHDIVIIPTKLRTLRKQNEQCNCKCACCRIRKHKKVKKSKKNSYKKTNK